MASPILRFDIFCLIPTLLTVILFIAISLGWWNGRHACLRGMCRKTWGFKSPPEHHFAADGNLHFWPFVAAERSFKLLCAIVLIRRKVCRAKYCRSLPGLEPKLDKVPLLKQRVCVCSITVFIPFVKKPFAPTGDVAGLMDGQPS